MERSIDGLDEKCYDIKTMVIKIDSDRYDWIKLKKKLTKENNKLMNIILDMIIKLKEYWIRKMYQ